MFHPPQIFENIVFFVENILFTEGLADGPGATVAEIPLQLFQMSRDDQLCVLRPVFTRFPKDPNCEICKVTKSTRARSRTKRGARVDSLLVSKAFGEVITAR